jgi:hypothetical protein
LVRSTYDDRVRTVTASYSFDSFGEGLGPVDGNEMFGAAVHDKILLAGVIDADYTVADTLRAILDLCNVSDTACRA